MCNPIKRSRYWLAEEDAVLRDYYQPHIHNSGTPTIPGRTPGSIRYRAIKLGLRILSPTPWLTSEVRILTQEYPKTGVLGCMDKLPTHSSYAIDRKARSLRLKKPVTAKTNRHQAEAIETALKAAYFKHGYLNTALIDGIALHHGADIFRIKYRARKLGMLDIKGRRAWMPQEDQILRDNADLDLCSKLLKDNGYIRSRDAIYLRRYVISLHKENDDLYTIQDLAKLLAVDKTSVMRWAHKGWLPKPNAIAFGGAVAWTGNDLKAFLTRHTDAWDIRKIDKHFLLSILTQS